jgi:glycosidase
MLVTFLDNHDLSRFYSMVNEDLDSYKMGIGFLLSTRGIPCIYYGTEILMKNYADPDGKVREDFPGGWPGDQVNKFEETGRTAEENEAFDFFRKLMVYRKNNPTNFYTEEEMGFGKLTQYVPENGIYVYFRDGFDSKLMVIMNFNKEESPLDLKRFKDDIGDSQYFYDIMDEKEITDRDSLVLPGRSIKWIQVSY